MTRALLALALVAGCTTGTAQMQSPTSAPIVIDTHYGGNAVQVRAEADRLAATGRPVRVRTCMSSCMYILSIPNACMAPGDRLGLHYPTQEIAPGFHQPLHDNHPHWAEMARRVPPQIVEAVRATRWSTDPMNPWPIATWITHADAPRYGLRQC